MLSKSSFDALTNISWHLYEQLMLRISIKSSGLIGFRLASEISAEIASRVLAPIYSQMNPEIVGGEYRDLQVAAHYGMRLIEYSNNADEDTVMHLIEHYPSHDFIIDDDEAKSLFTNVELPSSELYIIAGSVNMLTFGESDDVVVMALTPKRQETKHDEDANSKTKEANDGARRKGDQVDDSGPSDRGGDQEPGEHTQPRDPARHDTEEPRASAKSTGGSGAGR